jgi:hypothetical protein
MFPSARTFDPPGTIFRINREGTRFDVADISKEVNSTTGNEDIPDQTGRRLVAGNVLGNLLKGQVSAELSATGSYEVRMKLSGVEREKTTDADLDKSLALALKQVSLRTDNRYYVIRETISAREVAYNLSSADLASAATKLGTTPVGNGKVNVRQQDSNTATLVGSYDKPYRLFYKAEEVKFTSSGLTGDLKVSRLPVQGPLDWHEVGHTE